MPALDTERRALPMPSKKSGTRKPAPTNYPALFAKRAARCEKHLRAVEAELVLAYRDLERLIAEVHPCELWSDEMHDVQLAYGFDALYEAEGCVNFAPEDHGIFDGVRW